MRSPAVLTSARDAVSDHACLAYSTRPERDAAAIDWLLEGARLGQRLLAVAPDDDGGAGLLAALAARDPKFPRANVIFLSIDLSRPIDPEAQLAAYAEMVRCAIANGFNGLRVFCDITPMIADPARRAGHARWEHFADAWMARGNPLAPLCGYDITVVGEEPQGVMAVHPLRRGPEDSVVPFGLYNTVAGPVLDGELDVFAVPALAEALAALPDGPVDLDVSELRFLGVRAAMILANARARGARLRLTGAPPIVRRVWRLLGLDMRMLAGGSERV